MRILLQHPSRVSSRRLPLLGRNTLALLLLLVLAGCATTRIDWNTRVGQYTFDDAVLELGPPDKTAKLSDGTQVCEWLTQRGGYFGSPFYSRGRWPGPRNYETPMPDTYLRLTFNPQGQLTKWARIVK